MINAVWYISHNIIEEGIKLSMVDQEREFLKSEADEWFKRNVHKISNSSPEIAILCNWLMPFQKEVQSILEIGSGCGNKLSQLCWQLNSRGNGVDPSNLAVDFANKNFGEKCHFEVGTADSLPSHLENFDLIHFGFCLYLVSRNRVADCIEKADRLLKPGRFLSITDFDPRSPHANDYVHLKGLKSYKDNYYEMFCDLGNYTLVNKYSFSTENYYFSVDPYLRTNLTLLFKEK